MRRIRIATVSFRIDAHPHTIAGNAAAACAIIAEAAARGADIVCLPEAVLTANVPAADSRHAEPARGPLARMFAAAACEHRINVIAPYLVRSGKRIYNQATVLDRRGKVAGIYRKVQLNGYELPWITPGDRLPVIDLDIGRIAVMLCLDIHFPEIARIYAMKDADILFWPTITHGPTQEALRTQARARALDHSLIVVEANLGIDPPYAPYRGRTAPSTARIIDHNGDILAQTGRRPGVVCADVDLDERRLTLDCVLTREPDDMRADLARLFRADLYAREYALIAEGMHRMRRVRRGNASRHHGGDASTRTQEPES